MKADMKGRQTSGIKRSSVGEEMLFNVRTVEKLAF